VAGRATAATGAGLFFTTLATLMLQILLTRIFSVTLWYHFAFMAVSIAMFGMTLGAIWVYLSPARFPAERVHEQLAAWTLAFAVAIVVCFVGHLYVPFLTGTGSIAPPRGPETGGDLPGTIAYLGLTFLVISVPFVCSGVAVCLALTRFPRQLNRLYALDLAGAALGCILVVGVLGVVDAPAAVFVVSALAAAGAACFAWPGRGAGTRRVAAAALTVALLLSGGSVWLGARAARGDPALRLLFVKGEPEPVSIYEKWNATSYFRVRGNPRALVQPFGWGFSEEVRGRRVKQLAVAIDAGAGTVMTAYDGDTTQLDYLRYDVTNLAHRIRRGARTLVVGVGGGRDVLSALYFDQPEVVGVEINRDLLEALTGRFGPFTGHLDRDPRVVLVADEARSYIARQEESFDLIQISLIDSWAATAAGGFVLSENGLYTIEAWDVFLDKLGEDGVLSVSRWYQPDEPAETQRLVALATQALVERGVAEPSRNLIAVANLAPDSERTLGICTLLVSPKPFSPADLARLATTLERLRFTPLAVPGTEPDPRLAGILASRDLFAFAEGFPYDVSPPTDDRPFFFNMLRLRDVLQPIQGRSMNEFNLRAVKVLGALLAIVVGLTGLFLLGPLALGGQMVPRSAGPWLVYFGGIGFGFMLVEVSQIQRLTVFLGHPTYGLSVLLFSLLLSSGLGSLLTPAISSPADARRAGWRLLALLGLLLAFGAFTPSLTEAWRGEPTPVRIGAAVALLFPLGLFLGTAFPLGMGLASLRHSALTPWFWGVNGATSVCASVLAVAVAMTGGISAAFAAGALCYAVATAAFLVALRAESSA
jgi:SAM-dependent methyltransferase